MSLKKLIVAALLLTFGASAAQAAGKRCTEEKSLRSTDSKLATSVTFVNRTQENARIYWLNYKGGREFYKELRPDQRFTQDTYATHPWVATDAEENCLETYMPQPRASTMEIR
jgi:von Hippel-Lindau disease tumor suppressor protein